MCSLDMGYLKSSVVFCVEGEMSESELIFLLQEKRAKKEVYVISMEFAGKLPLKEGITIMNKETGSLLYCGDGVGYYQAEQEQGAPERYVLLEANKRFIPL